jgi:hypothetical protein
MMYLLIIVGIGQLVYIVYSCKMLISVKRRSKSMDARIGHLTEWIIIYNQSVTQKLHTIHEQLQTAPAKNSDQKVTIPVYDDAVESKLIAVLSDLSQKEVLAPYYILLLEHLEQLHKNTGKSLQPAETLLRPVNGYAG